MYLVIFPNQRNFNGYSFYYYINLSTIERGQIIQTRMLLREINCINFFFLEKLCIIDFKEINNNGNKRL